MNSPAFARALIRCQRGMTLVEMLVALVIALIAMAGFFSFLEAITRSSANDQERNVSLVEQTAAIHRIASELSQAYEVNYPTSLASTTEYNVIDVDVYQTQKAGEQRKRRIVVNCEEATAIPNHQECITYETEVSDGWSRESMATDGNAHKRVDIVRLDDGTKASKVFKLSDPSKTGGGERPTYGQITVETPAAGERVTVKNQHLYTYQVLLKDSFYMRNLDFAQ